MSAYRRNSRPFSTIQSPSLSNESKELLKEKNSKNSSLSTTSAFCCSALLCSNKKYENKTNRKNKKETHSLLEKHIKQYNCSEKLKEAYINDYDKEESPIILTIATPNTTKLFEDIALEHPKTLPTRRGFF